MIGSVEPCFTDTGAGESEGTRTSGRALALFGCGCTFELEAPAFEVAAAADDAVAAAAVGLSFAATTFFAAAPPAESSSEVDDEELLSSLLLLSLDDKA